MKRFAIFLTLLMLLASGPHGAALERRDTVSRKKERVSDTLKVKVKQQKLMDIADTLTDEFLDTVNVQKQFVLNDYSSIGVWYGYGGSQGMFNPTKQQGILYTPVHFGVEWTKYCKLFGYMPYFALKVGACYGQDGYQFKLNEKGEWSSHVDGAVKAVYDVAELYSLGNFHLDVWHVRMMVDAGLYGGYCLKVNREGPAFDTNYTDRFYEYEHRLDYGLKAGAGIGFIFDPIEFQIMGHFKYAFSTLYDPDYYSQYYYRFAHPMSVIISAGVKVQLTKRTGKTNAQLKKQAREMVYKSKSDEYIDGKGGKGPVGK